MWTTRMRQRTYHSILGLLLIQCHPGADVRLGGAPFDG